MILQKEELVEALINTNCNTTPGIDGITKYDIIQLTDDEKKIKPISLNYLTKN